ncbi:MAG: AAA family ATPase [Clostridia bacterium]|nr:AAA family ATPase [Clostridia bacterium]
MSAFDKIIGYEEVKRNMRQVVDMIKNYSEYERLGAKIPHGVLIYGEPGVGKTLFATALIEEAGIPYTIIRHDMAKEAFCEHIRKTFEKMALENERAVILLDDIDKFASSAKKGDEFAVVQSCIDSVKDKNIFVMATANDTGILPESLIRAGRFDRIIEIGNPEGEDAVAIITHYMEGIKVSETINYEDIAKMLAGRSCATLESVINEAAIEAAFGRRDCIEMSDFVKSTLTSVYGLENRCGSLDSKKKEETAYHEAGHAVIAEVLMPGYIGMLSLSSNDLSGMGGFALRCKRPERRAYEILIALGGKASSEMKYGKVASGTSGDLDDAQWHLRQSIGSVGSVGVSHLFVPGMRASETSVANIELAIHSELERYLFKAKEIIAQNREFLEKTAKELLEKETLLYSDMKRIRESCTITPAVVG